MLYTFLGIVIGVILGIFSHVSIPIEHAHYTAVVILGLLDAIFGAIRSDVVDNTYNSIVFLSGLVFNALLALLITYFGESVGLNLYLAATVVFTFRIFQNVGITRRVLLEKWIEHHEIIKNAKKAAH